MAQEAPARTKIPTKSPQPARGGAARPAGRAKVGRIARGSVLASGTGRAATRGGGPVIELECGITVYPAREEQGRWRSSNFNRNLLKRAYLAVGWRDADGAAREIEHHLMGLRYMGRLARGTISGRTTPAS